MVVYPYSSEFRVEGFLRIIHWRYIGIRVRHGVVEIELDSLPNGRTSLSLIGVVKINAFVTKQFTTNCPRLLG